ncbi:hypothetical protein BGX26_011260, partial [Mortierella sp. AD094]
MSLPSATPIELNTQNDMQAIHRERVANYFKSRSENDQGAISEYLLADTSEASVFVHNNDYLRLADNLYVTGRQVEQLETCSQRAFFSSTLLEDDTLHLKLESSLSQYYGKECILTQSGYVANTGLMHAICEPGMHIYTDKFTHASFFDGLRAKGTKLHVSPHNDLAHMEANMKKHGPGLIIIETLYSSNGTFAPVEEVIALKYKYGCILVVDESHTLGIYGTHGYLHMLGVEDDVDYITASLAKTFCTRAGIIMGSSALFVKENSLPYIFSSALTENDIVRLECMLEVIKNADDRRERLMRVSHELREGLVPIANVIRTPIPSPIICLEVESELKVAKLNRHLALKGITAAVFVWPTRPRDLPVVRMTAHSELTAS